MSIRKIGVMSLLAGLLTVGAAANVTGVTSVHAQVAAAGQGPGTSYFCAKPQHKNNPHCRSKNRGGGNPAAASAAIAAAIAAINKANACRPVSSAACQALIQAANQAAANATQLARTANTTPPTFPSTGGGGTAPGAGTAAAVGGVVSSHGLPYAVSGGTGAVNGSTGVHSLPATGGGVPSSPNNSWLALILAAMALMAGGVALRANSRR